MKDIFKEFIQYHTSNLVTIKETTNRLEALEAEKYDQFIDLIRSIIQLVDTFENAEQLISEKGWDQSEESKKVINRYRNVYNQLIRLLSAKGVTKLEFPENRLIIGFCRVVETEPDSTKANDTIISIVRNGYIRGSELIRPADVIIVKN